MSSNTATDRTGHSLVQSIILILGTALVLPYYVRRSCTTLVVTTALGAGRKARIFGLGLDPFGFKDKEAQNWDPDQVLVNFAAKTPQSPFALGRAGRVTKKTTFPATRTGKFLRRFGFYVR